MDDIRAYARRSGIKPATVLQKVGLSGTTWGRWEDGVSSPTLRTLEKVRKYMADNPPSAAGCAQPEVAA